MKKKILAYICMLMPIWVSAQILNDSTVQVVAYWRLGDTYKYEYQTNEYTVEGNDTIWGDSSHEIFAIEVVDSTENGYVLKYSSIENSRDTKDKELEAILKPIMDKYQDFPIYFSTNTHGAFQDIARWDELQLTVDSIFTDVRENMDKYFFPNGEKEKMSAEEFQNFENFINQLFQSFKNKEMTLMGMDFLYEPLYYHGTKLEQGREYSGKQKFASPWINSELIDADVILNIHKVDYESSWVTFHRTQRYEASQLLDSFYRYMQQAFPPEQRKDLTPDQLPFIMVETFFDLDVHVNTGWPGATYYEKTIQVGPKKNIKSWLLEMIFDE